MSPWEAVVTGFMDTQCLAKQYSREERVTDMT